MRKIAIYIWMSLISVSLYSQEVNYDENKVPDFQLPELLTTFHGKSINDASAWESVRRPEILNVFREQMYGTNPVHQVEVDFKLVKNKEKVLDGVADLKEIDLIFSNDQGKHTARLLLFLPAHVEGPVPVFLGMNFYGNHTIHPSASISLHQSWARDNPLFLISDQKVDDRSRGVRSSRWPVEYILSHGYGLGVIYYGDIDPDYDDEFQNGLHPLFYKKGQTKPTEKEWGSIGIWAWSLSRALDYLETDAKVDHDKVIVFGHSRLGKTSLWAGAQDQRFAGIISNNSGCGGAALSKRKVGETVKIINNAFPHWFNDYFTRFNNNEEELPFDQHMLISLMAPRPVYIASAKDDEWADPRGEYLSGYYAAPAYKLYNMQTPSTIKSPAINQPRMTESVSYHIRSGRHDVTRYDWAQYIRWADKYIK
ncbi:hypothetical protein KUV50_08180 [Membranicola marinus]|uniref:4-O-methyl-glucuronoyl methylesterase-like domain-containing protein n=1 Tax=Membranihabitans marinus TaxID=1227546 RepID=A0A953HLZ4_9BACT|nr:hypothetical protein [Membranihabitans marinus]MBY5958102.1 hypothetical protein [Membranihabitans marinus]